MSQDIQEALSQISPMFPGVSVDKMSESLNAAVAGAHLSTEDIISQLKSPFSRLRKDMGAYITDIFVKEQLEKQERYLQMIQLERGQIQILSQKSGISSQAANIDEKMLAQLEPIPAKNQELLQKLQVQSHELDSLYKEYERTSQNVVRMEMEQRTEFNASVERMGLDPRYQLTEARQTRLHDLFTETETNTEKLKETTGKVTTESEKSLLNEIKFMREQTETGEQHNLKPSEILKLAKGKDPETDKSLFQTFNGSEKGILSEINKLGDQMQQIEKKQAEMAQTARQINQNTASLVPVLMPNFSSARNSDELQEKLEKMYEAVEKTHQKGAGYNPSAAFEIRLGAQIRNMPLEERNDFFKKAEGFVAKNDKGFDISSALNNLREKYSPALQAPDTPTPFETKPRLLKGQ